MTEDILEQLVDNYYKRQGSVFSKHNVKYRPKLDHTNITTKNKNKYSVHSDIDVLCLSTLKKHAYAVSCKSWQTGFDCKLYFENLEDSNFQNKIVSGREIWKRFREITKPIWAEAFREKVITETQTKSFTYVVAVTKLKNEDYRKRFEESQTFIKILKGNSNIKIDIEILTLSEIFESIWSEKQTTAVENSEIGRLIQLMKAAGIKITKP